MEKPAIASVCASETERDPVLAALLLPARDVAQPLGHGAQEGDLDVVQGLAVGCD